MQTAAVQRHACASDVVLTRHVLLLDLPAEACHAQQRPHRAATGAQGTPAPQRRSVPAARFRNISLSIFVFAWLSDAGQMPMSNAWHSIPARLQAQQQAAALQLDLVEAGRARVANTCKQLLAACNKVGPESLAQSTGAWNISHCSYPLWPGWA